ncbi:MAG: hypothetical protein IJX70_02570 [Clostridia bacterium]|nr:hypothetical protein [Clostridia bacterium]
MTCYELRLPEANRHARRLRRLFLLWGLTHFVLGFAFTIVVLVAYWRLVFVPVIWFMLGFIPGSISYLFCTAYRYVWRKGELTIYRQRRFAKEQVVAILTDYEVVERQASAISCTTDKPNLWLKANDKVYELTADNYLTALVKGEIYVS